MPDLSQAQPTDKTQNIPTGNQPPAAPPPTDLSGQSSPPPPGQDQPLKGSPLPQQEKIKEDLSKLGISPPGTNRKTKIILAALGVFFLVASLPVAVYLVQQRQEIRKEASPGVSGDMGCPFDDVTLGPGAYSFEANGAGLENRSSASFAISLPTGAAPLADHVYAFWSGEKPGNVANPNGITINGASLNGEKIYSMYHSDWDVTGYIYRVKVPADLISGTSLTFNISGLGLPQGNSGARDEETPGAHGVSIVVPYQKSDLPQSKIIIRSCGDYVYHTKKAHDYSDPLIFNFPDIIAEGSSLKAALFFGEGEGDRQPDAVRPNSLTYNGVQIDPTDGSYPAGSSDGGYWWDTRVTGDDLPAITSIATSATFIAFSPLGGNTSSNHGDSYYFLGGVLQYPVEGPSEELTCSSITRDPETELEPNDEITLTCIGTTTLEPIDSLEFRIKPDNGTLVELETSTITESSGQYEGQVTYTVPEYDCYQVECRACNTSGCTSWELVP